MITDFLMRRARSRREARSRFADALSRKLEQEQTLAVDDELVSSMGMERRAFFRAVYAMVIQERMHMMADSDGRVLLMTNAEFHRFMLRQSGVRETEIRRREGIAALADTMAEHAAAAFDEETAVIDAVEAEFAENPEFVESAELATLAPALAAEPLRTVPSPLADADSATDADSGDDLGWFNLDVAPARAGREKLPKTRQSVPDRRREPWNANEESRIHF